jgi:hypothetical protein
MKWRVMVELFGAVGTGFAHEIGGGGAADEYSPRVIGLTLAEGNQMLAALRRDVVQGPAEDHCHRRRRC